MKIRGSMKKWIISCVDYIKGALRTEPQQYYPERVNMRALHAYMGLTTEVGELVDTFKKHIFYGKEIDHENLVEEMGDLFWYTALMADELGVSFEEIMQKNNTKLRLRFPDRFTEDKALNRNLTDEREVFEKVDKK